MAVHFEDHQWRIRCFVAGAAFGADPEAVALATRTGPDRAELSMTHGHLTRADMRDIYRGLIARGIRFATIYRAKGRRVPFGRIIRQTAHLAEWEVDLHAIEGN